MDNNKDDGGLKWYHVRTMWVKLTGKYVGGLIAGFGLGVGITAAHAKWALVAIFSLPVVWLGAAIAYDAQTKRAMDEELREKR
ncbi:MAG: hypothetical protein GX594_18620 [Pirellulaceae bacterium]|nr:hypothetical protein [Pirellulaceae bacterium]